MPLRGNISPGKDTDENDPGLTKPLWARQEISLFGLKRLVVLCIVAAIAGKANAHEPLYGLGPETLPKYLNAVELGARLSDKATEYELSYGFGITQNWTVRLDVPAISTANEIGLGNIKLRIKYALWRKTEPGILKRLTVIVAASFPSADNNLAPDVTAITLGLANGYESRRWYNFSDIAYTSLDSGGPFKPGNQLKYNLVGGIRPVKSSYLKPDLVLLLELNGELNGKSKQNGDTVSNTEGNTLAVAPGVLFSHRNIMLKGGIQFGISNTANVNRKQTNGLISLEYHF